MSIHKYVTFVILNYIIIIIIYLCLHLKKRNQISLLTGVILDCDVLGVILNKMVSLYYYLQFSLVCKSWYFLALRHKHHRSIITSKFPQLPMLIVPSKDGLEEEHCSYDLTRDIVRPVDFKFCFNKRCCGPSFGWLISVIDTRYRFIQPFFWDCDLSSSDWYI